MRRARILVLVGASLAACREESPTPPTAADPVAELPCADAGVLALGAPTATSTLAAPLWSEHCVLCGLTSASAAYTQGEATLLSFVGWSESGRCVVTAPLGPPAVAEPLTRTTTLGAALGTAEWSDDLPLSADRGVEPLELGAATWRLDLATSIRHPAGLPLPLLGDTPELLLSLRQDGAGQWSAHTAPGDGTGQRATCEASSQLPVGPVRLERQWSIPLDGATLVDGGAVVRGGVLHARPTPLGDGLLDVQLIARFDLSGLEPRLGLGPEELCATLDAEAGPARCAPCSDPSAGLDGLPVCVTTIWEWAEAPAAPDPLSLIAPDDLPPHCVGDDDSAAP